MFSGAVSFKGWKEERVVLKDDAKDLRVLAVRSNDPPRHWEKAKAVVQVADEFLGFSQSVSIRQEDKSVVYLAVMGKRVAGCLLAEPLRKNDRLSCSYLERGVRWVFQFAKIKCNLFN